MMTDGKQCDQCSARLPAGAPEGLCPRCLLKLGLAGEDEPQEGELVENRAPGFYSQVGAVTLMKAAPAPFGELAGTRIDNYEIICSIGRGGFGTVYKARDVKLGRDVALKFLHHSPSRMNRHLFEREARALAALSKHSAIVQVYAWGEYEGHNYFVMEYIESSTSKLLRSFPDGLPWHLAVKIVADCAEALAYAHRHSILHRDIKPGNILVETDDYHAKLADFGMAKFYEISEATLSGHISGSPPYMSPEQASGKLLDHRSDIFSLGVTLYELLCGRQPFGAGTSEEVITRIRQDEKAPLEKQREDLPSEIVDIANRAMAHEPDARYPSASMFAQDLRKVLNTTGDTPSSALNDRHERPRPASRMKWALAAMAAVVFLTGLAVTLFHVGKREEGGPSEPWTSRPLKFFVPSLEAESDRLANELGLPDIPWSLSKELTEISKGPTGMSSMRELEREHFDEVKRELEISRKYSSGPKQLIQGQIYGLRLIIRCECGEYEGREFLTASVIDVEQSTKLGVKQEVSQTEDGDTIVQHLASRIWDKVREAYPIQGRLTKGWEGPELNIGTLVGVKEGARFSVLRKPDVRTAIPGAAAIVLGDPGAPDARVRLEGMAPEKIPDEGLYVVEEAALGPSSASKENP